MTLAPTRSTQPPQTRTQYIADVLREQILSGKIAGGAPLTQQTIAENFQVSRIPVREALLLLQAEGLVELIPHKGAAVVELSARQVTELFELRCLLEGSLLRSAIPHLSEADFRHAENILQTFNKALDNGKSIAHWSDYNQQFHYALYAPSRNRETFSLVDILNLRCARYVRMQLLYTKKIKKAQSEHAQLITLCRDQRIDEACEFLHQHIWESGESIRQLLSPLDDNPNVSSYNKSDKTLTYNDD